MPRLRDRATADLIIIALTGVVCLVVLVTVGAVIVVKLENPTADVAVLARQVGEFISSLIAVIVGYLAGRGATPPGSGGEDRQDKQG